MKFNKNRDNDRLDRIYRNLMLANGITTAVLFILSLVAAIEFPGAFKYFAIGMLCFAVIFLILRSVHKYRSTFKVRVKK